MHEYISVVYYEMALVRYQAVIELVDYAREYVEEILETIVEVAHLVLHHLVKTYNKQIVFDLIFDYLQFTKVSNRD